MDVISQTCDRKAEATVPVLMDWVHLGTTLFAEDSLRCEPHCAPHRGQQCKCSKDRTLPKIQMSLGGLPGSPASDSGEQGSDVCRSLGNLISKPCWNDWRQTTVRVYLMLVGVVVAYSCVFSKQLVLSRQKECPERWVYWGWPFPPGNLVSIHYHSVPEAKMIAVQRLLFLSCLLPFLLGAEPSALRKLSKYSTTEPHLQPPINFILPK